PRANDNGVTVLSCPDAIAQAIKEAMGQVPNTAETILTKPCPDCGQPLRRDAGCFVCESCAYSKCG
ncbi:MAG: hypothetical protein J7M14_05890, partial [Planctomycetes bacterium]|nr:hypothetical protein [Planctomycetota bacterium]